MADGYISQIKTPDNKVYLLKDSEKTDEKVKQSSNTEDKEFPIILKNTNNTTNETNGVKYAGGVTVNPSEKTVTATEFIGKLNMGRLVPIDTKTYNAPLYQSSGANFYQNFATVTPVDYNAIWIAHYRITITAAGHSDYTEICDVSISGRNNTWYTYNIYNSIVTYSIYQHMLLNSNSATVPHELGYRMQGSYGADSVAKVVKVELLEQLNCTVALLDNLKLYTSATPSGYTWRGFNATSNGLQETGDNDAYGYYILSNGFKGKAGSNKVYRQCLFARTGDGTYESFVMQDNTVATTKTANPHGFVPDGKIYWNSNNTVYSAGTLNLSVYQQYHVIDYRYSFNFDNTFLPDYCETYVVYTYNEDDGLLYLDSTQWFAAALPTTADGKIYQRIGSKYYTGTSNYYQGSLLLENPYYEFKNGKIRTWAPSTRGIKSITRSGTTFTATRDDGSTFTFTQQDTNKYHKTGSWSGLTYTATAVNSADELKFTIPNKIQTNWELNATSGNSPALLFTRDSTLTDWKIFVTSGKLSFQSATDGSTWTERAYFKDNSGDFVATSFTGKGSDLTDLNGSNISSGTVALARLPMGNANTALMGKGSSTAPAYVSVSPSISITAGTADNAPKVNLTVLGVSGTTAQELTKATTGVYGATKLYNGVDSTSTALAATANAVKTAYDKAAGIVAAADAMVFKGTLDGAASTKYTPAADRGHTYKVAVAGLINGEPVEVGDILICTTDSTAAATSSNVNTIKANWVIIQNNVDGAVFYGSNSLSNGQYLVADGANGKVKSQALPTASTTIAGITTVGASGGAAAYSHGTHVSYGTSTAKIGTAAAGTASTVSRSDHVHAIDLATGDNNGQVKIAGTNVTVKGLGDRAFDSTSYLPLGGGTLTGALTTANNTWNTIGDDAYLGDINKAGHIGIQGKNGNTGIFFTTYNQTTKTTGGAITWDGTKFSITSTTAVDASISGNAATATTATNLSAKPSLATSGNNITVTAGGKTSDAFTVPYATSAGSATHANYLTGFSSRATTMTWGNQTGSVITCFATPKGGGWGFRDDNPAAGQVSMTIDGTVYIKEGGVNIADAVKSFSVSGQTVTYTNLWGGTGTFTTQDTKNTAGSTNSASKLFLIGATSQAANPTTNSYQYTYATGGLLSSTQLGLNVTGTEKVYLEWNATDSSLDFVFA